MEESITKWVDKYRPNTINDIVLNADIKKTLLASIEGGNNRLTNMTLIGKAGIGKTTLALAISNMLNADMCFMSCSSGDGRIDKIESKLIPFVSSKPMMGIPMIVILDELDSASSSGDSNFQKALRNVIESAPHVTFICTANYNKIIPAVLSRCPIFNLSFDVHDLFPRIKTILDTEKITYTKESLKSFCELYFKRFYPDIRSIVNALQVCSQTGELVVSNSVKTLDESNKKIEKIMHDMAKINTISAIRQYYLDEIIAISDWTAEEVCSSILNYCIANQLFKDDSIENVGVLQLSEILYRINLVNNKDIQVLSFLIKTKQLMK